jgi:hypothetical protein
MSGRDSQSPAALGFLTVIEHEQLGLVGGYLLLNLSGRPLEFHCTAPIKPNRAQQILYGPTLEPYLYGEQIGQALTAKSGIQPLCICTDREPALALGDHVQQPVVWIAPREDAPSSADESSAATIRFDRPHGLKTPLAALRVGCNSIGVRSVRGGDAELVRQRLAGLDPNFDLAEPFGRIREAIEEAQRGGR